MEITFSWETVGLLLMIGLCVGVGWAVGTRLVAAVAARLQANSRRQGG